MGGEVDDADPHALEGQVLRHLQADEAASGHHGPLDASGLHRLPQGNGVVGGAHDEDVLHVQPRHVRHEGGSPGGDDQLVVGVGGSFACFEVLGLHGVLRRMDRHGLGLGEDLRAGELLVLLRGVDDELGLVLDDAAYVVGQAAPGVGDVFALGQHRHLAGTVLPQELCGRLRSCRHAAQYQYFHAFAPFRLDFGCSWMVHYIIWRFSAQEDFAGADRKSAGRPSPPGLDAKARGLKPPGRYQVWFPSRRSFRRSSGPSGMRTAPLAASSPRERYPQGAAAGSIPTARAKTISVPLSPT